MKAFIGN